MSDKNLIVVTGPTAVGKTALTIRLARELSTEIISADSRQFYREMSIGTAKPTPEELAQVPHHFINSHAVDDECSAGEFESATLKLLKVLFGQYDSVIMTGGSGLYINAVTAGLPDIPKGREVTREVLNRELADNGLAPLLEELQATDPIYYQEVDTHNPQRVIRALEVIRDTGIPFSEFRKGSVTKRPFNIIKIGLSRDRDELYERINQRVDAMVAQGLLEEVRALLPYRHLQALQTVGYKEVFDYLDDQYTWQETVELIKRNTRRYAKRQMTWFRKDAEMAWFSPEDYDKIKAYVCSKV